MATKIIWLHLSTGIPLNQPIAFTYQLILIDLLVGRIIRIHLLLRIGLLTSHCWEAHRLSFYYLLICWESAFLHRIIEKHTSHHSGAVLIPIHQYPICWDASFLDSILLGFGFPLTALQLQANDGVILQIKFGWPDHYERSWQLWCRHAGLDIKVNKRLSKQGFRLLERIRDLRRLGRMCFVKDKV